MSHADHVVKLPKGFKRIASTRGSKFTIIENDAINRYGIQFHPESIMTEHGKKILKNWINIC